jgi:hypothetical protein
MTLQDDRHAIAELVGTERFPGESWRLASFEGIYHKDTIVPVNPYERVPLDWGAARPAPVLPRLGLHDRPEGYEIDQGELGDERWLVGEG